ncbi:hypothetical protein [Gracilimonas mengyeensis]|uniref:Tfp pilus assembly protein PilN n=1 Tax=Gracilimonas mengyeensis TaxID=1302730 RepID=A0A521AKX3_9BACT|nr:hypothetical protein [Gracilimonas mengyeensis]SMO35469.1 Tfp pilus assembly protein PilN [Gracilimonas mengyeensis]
MISGKTYTGLVVDGDALKVAMVKVTGKKLTLVGIDKVRLVENLKEEGMPATIDEDGGIFDSVDDPVDSSEIFGFETEEEVEDADDELKLEEVDDDIDDLGFDDLEDSDQIVDSDMVDETETPASNELLLYNLFSLIDAKRINLGLSIPAGQTIFQILKDSNFSKTKRKDLEVIVNDRLEALHGVPKAEDYYSYSVADDGTLLLTSIDEEPGILNLVNNTLEIYRGKLFVEDVVPDEVALVGLVRANYELEETTITGVIQFGEKKTRIIFMKGEQLWIVSPIITEGIKDQRFLSTVFSKILFQLDTGEVPNLDRLILCNNSLGEKAVTFFEDRFQDVEITEFEFSDEIFDAEGINKSSLPAFTTAIGAAWAASGFQHNKFPDISFLPDYVQERQKIFKLQWHGILLLLLILLTPIVSNHFYTQNAAEINRLETDISQLNAQIESLEPTVQEYNRISSELEQIQAQLQLLSELSQGTLRWSTNLDLINNGVDDVNMVWLTSMNQSDGGVEINGIATRRSAIADVAEIFDRATLLNVSTSEIREQDVYNFRYQIQDFFDTEDIYTPEAVQGIEDLIQQP